MYECYSVPVIQGLSDQNVSCSFKSKLLEQTPLLVTGGVTNESTSPDETMRLKDSMLANKRSTFHLKYHHHIGNYAKQAVTS